MKGASLLLGICLLAAFPAMARGASSGVIRGEVVIGTSPVRPLSGQVVRLEIVERSSTTERRTLSGPGGEFAFPGLPVGGVRAFVLRTDYRGVSYASRRIVLTPGAPIRSVELRVYEPTRDLRAVRSALLFAVVEVGPGALRVSVVRRFVNTTDRAVLTADAPLTFPLPPGARQVIFLDGFRDPHVVGNQIEDTPVLLPGLLQVSYSYQLPVRRGRAEVPFVLAQGVGEADVLVPAQGVRVEGKGLRLLGPVAAQGRTYQRWSGGPVPPGGRVAVRVAGIPAGEAAWPEAVAVGLAGVLAAALLLGVLGPHGPLPS